MGKFIVRVELHNETNYEKLHQEMEKLGFSRTIDSKGGKLYQLPTAEYYIAKKGDAVTINNILLLAKKAAKSVTPKYSILATEFKKTTWLGLTECEES